MMKATRSLFSNKTSGSLSVFVLDEYIDFLESEGDEEDELETLKRIEKQCTNRNLNQKVADALNELTERTYWLFYLLNGEKCYNFPDRIAEIPDFSVWEKEKEDIDSNILNFNYWLLAHYFMGNIEECKWLIEKSQSHEAELVKLVANEIKGVIEDSGSLGKLKPKYVKELTEEVQMYITPKHVSPDRKIEIKTTPRDYLNAIRDGDYERVKSILSEGMDVDTDDDDDTPLVAAVEEEHSDIVRLLIEHGVDVNHHGDYEECPIAEAASNDNIEIIEILLDAGAEINTASYFNDPLIVASKGGSVEVIEFLIERGADPNMGVALNENSALHEAVSYLGGFLENAETLIKLGADVNGIGEYGRTPIFKAVSKEDCDIECIKLLLEHGADVNFLDEDGSSPLIIASREPNVDIIKLLIENGANKEHKDNDGNDAFHYAKKYGIEENMKALS